MKVERPQTVEQSLKVLEAADLITQVTNIAQERERRIWISVEISRDHLRRAVFSRVFDDAYWRAIFWAIGFLMAWGLFR